MGGLFSIVSDDVTLMNLQCTVDSSWALCTIREIGEIVSETQDNSPSVKR